MNASAAHMRPTLLSRLANAACLPLRLLLSHERVNRLGLRSIRDERYDMVRRHCRGRLLDIGCGNNQLVKDYGHDSVGVDVFDFGGGATIVADAAELPFPGGSFGTVSLVASLNHIPNRRDVVREACRVLVDGGRIVLTMIGPGWGKLRHKLAWWDPDQKERPMAAGEEMGLTHEYLLSLMEECGLR
ncbi:MAG: class I SAM-dependent methyltransferase, partial [Planctomycetota bacterium]